MSDKEDFETDKVLKSVIDVISGLLATAAELICSQKNDRMEVSLKDDDSDLDIFEKTRKVEVTKVKYMNYEFSVIDVIETINKLAVKDSLKHYIFTTGGMEKSIKSIVMNGKVY